MANSIEVLDAICGSGKTQGIIEWMNKNPDNRYLYISPLLDEIERRIPNECGLLNFDYPEVKNGGSKSAHLLELLVEGRNISFTHALFKNMTKEHLFWIRKWEYVLIIDEEVEMITQLDEYSYGDVQLLLDNKIISVNEEDGRVVWEIDYEHTKYDKLLRMSKLGMVYMYGTKIKDDKIVKNKNHEKSERASVMMVVHLPIELISSSSRCILLTYLFNGSIFDNFVRMKGIKIETFTDVRVTKHDAAVKNKLSKLIEMVGIQAAYKLRNHSMSVGDYKKLNQLELTNIGKIITNLCKNSKVKKENVMWTIPQYYVEPSGKNRPKISLGAYKYELCYVACNSRATNNYAHKELLIHAFNRYPNTVVAGYLKSNGFPIDEDNYALSELIQWIWRSRIRNDQPIKLCLLSERMNRLFQKWLNEG